jgi:hypothetical protein
MEQKYGDSATVTGAISDLKIAFRRVRKIAKSD